MSKHENTNLAISGPKPADDVHGRLARLGEAITASDSSREIDRLLQGVFEAVERTTAEHSGMADELLFVYEQIGVIYEVTRRLPTVQNETEVIDLFLDSLRRSFDRRPVLAARRSHHGGWVGQGNGCEIPEWVDTHIGRARKSGTVVVEGPPAGTLFKPIAEVMIAPIFAGEEFVCAIVITRGVDVTPFQATDMLLLESLATFCGDLIRNHRLLHELRGMSITLVRSLVSAVDQKDEYTSGHSLRVGYFATLLGKRLNLTDGELQMLEWSALLHDVGKIGIRDDVLKKTGRLSGPEMDHIKEHPVRSHRVVQEVPQLRDALEGVLHHHERYDGTGYPTGLAGERIPLQARIIQIADIFDALTSDRAYRSAYDWPKALDILAQEAGQVVDPHLQRVFDQLMHEALDGDAGAWDRMVHRAGRFAQVTENDSSQDKGE